MGCQNRIHCIGVEAEFIHICQMPPKSRRQRRIDDVSGDTSQPSNVADLLCVQIPTRKEIDGTIPVLDEITGGKNGSIVGATDERLLVIDDEIEHVPGIR